MLLSKSLGPWDIQLSALPETLDAGYRIPIRMWAAAIGASPITLPFQMLLGGNNSDSVLASNIKQAYVRRLGRKPQHANAATIKLAFPNEWRSYTKFCVVRNPFSLAVSDYNWRTRNLKRPLAFVDYLKALAAGDAVDGVVPVGFYNNWRQYTIDDRVVVDHVIRFETLAHDLGNILTTIGLPFSGSLPHLKNSKLRKQDTRCWRDYYTPAAVELVADLYREEISAFGYTLE